VSRSPALWTTAQLARDAATAAQQFRAERLAVSDSWQANYTAARAKFETLFNTLGNLVPDSITDDSLKEVYSLRLGEALRYLAGPPVSDDDLKVIAGVDSIAPGVLMKDVAALRKVFGVIERVIDPQRFPWMQTRTAPSGQEREAALLASSVLLAAQRIATQRRNDGKQNQETRVQDFLRGLGFREAGASPINTIVKGPQAMEFCAECKLGDRKADVVVRLHDTRLLAIECKVSNSATNSVKRLNNDAAVKAVYWINQFGTAQVVPAAALAGVFNVLNLEQAQVRGLSLFWSHDLARLGEFIEATR
jgi:hypothetical protein